MMSSSLRKLVVGSNIINRSVDRFIKNTNNCPANLFDRSVIQFRPAYGSRLFNTGRSQWDLLYVRHMLNKDSERVHERQKQLDSSDGVWMGPYRVKDNAERLCLYIKMHEVSGEDLKVSVEHETVVVKGRLKHSYLGIKNYYCWFDSEYIDRFKLTDIKAEMKRKSGVLKLTIPKLKQEEVSVFNVKVNYVE